MDIRVAPDRIQVGKTIDFEAITGHGTTAGVTEPTFNASEHMAFLDMEAEMLERLAELALAR